MPDQPEPNDPTPDEPTPQEGPVEQPRPEGTPVPQGGTPLDRNPNLTFFYSTPAANPTASVVTYTYDAFGGLIGSSSQDTFGHTVTHTYDLHGNRLEPPTPLP